MVCAERKIFFLVKAGLGGGEGGGGGCGGEVESFCLFVR